MSPRPFLQIPTVVLLALAGCPIGDRVYWADQRLPRQVRQISIEGQKKNAHIKDICKQVSVEYGDPITDTKGDHWSIDGGVLSYDPIAGIYFVTAKHEMIRVERIKNPLDKTIFASYSLTTNATKDHQHEHYWLGTLQLFVDLSYSYEDSGQWPEQRFDQKQNFFMLHPEGTFELTYLNGFGPTTLCESIIGHKHVAKLTFHAAGASKAYYIAHKTFWHRIAFESDEPMEFEVDRWWDMN